MDCMMPQKRKEITPENLEGSSLNRQTAAFRHLHMLSTFTPYAGNALAAHTAVGRPPKLIKLLLCRVFFGGGFSISRMARKYVKQMMDVKQ